MNTVSANRSFSIGIVGGGFSGICVAAHLVFQAKSPLQIHIFERSPTFPGGEAFFTENILHPLNIRASQMGALTDDPEGFYRWVLENPHVLTDSNTHAIQATPDSFLSRKIYRAYLVDLWKKVVQTAATKGIHLQLNPQGAVDALVGDHHNFVIKLSNGSNIPVDSLIIATGAPVSKKLPFENESLLHNPRYVANLWSSKSLAAIANSADQKVLLIGSGLTAVDAISTLAGQGFKGQISVVSSSGSFPECHSDHAVAHSNYRTSDFTDGVTSVLKKVRKDIASTVAAGGDWRSIMNALRSCTQDLWRNFPLEEKERFMRHLFSHWNKFRHRMPLASGERISSLVHERRLSLHKGIVDKVEATSPDALQVCYRINGGTQTDVKEVNYVIKCCGPEYKIAKQGNQFLDSLLSKGLIQLDPLGLGLALASDFSVKGSVPGKIFSLGGLLFGEIFETTAVPEIREQADKISRELLAGMQ